jgi:hypothetical protein
MRIHGLLTRADLSTGLPVSGSNSKSYSYEIVDCSRPFSGFGGRISSLMVNVYFFSGIISMEFDI